MKIFALKFITAVLLFSISLQSADTLNIILTHYLINYEVAVQKCENKTRPELKCNGSCQLMKTLQKSESNNPQPKSTLQKSELILLDLPTSYLKISNIPFISFRLYNNSSEGSIQSPYRKIAIPPPEYLT
jgi:hypothetical protein